MEIDKAVSYTLNALSFTERALAQGLFESEQYHAKSGKAWQRSPKLNLTQAITKARAGAERQGFKARFISLYCDTLVIDRGANIATQDGKFFVIEVYARKLVYSLNEKNVALKVNWISGSEIVFFTQSIPADFQVEFTAPAGTKTEVPRIEADKFGVAVRLEGQGIEGEQYGAPETAMQNINYLDLIDESGNLKDKGFMNDDFPRLLQSQMLVAQAHIGLDRTLAVSILSYVCAASATKYSVLFNYQANTLRNSLMCSADMTYVSSVNVYSSKQVLKSRLIAAMAFEEAFRDFMLQSGNAAWQARSALNLLAKSTDALVTYDFLKKTRLREYDNAVEANTKAEATFQKNQKDLEGLTTAFNAGVEKWKRKQKRNAGWAIFKSIFSLGIAIAATVATGGAAAPAAVGAAVSTATAVGKIGKLLETLKSVAKKLKEVFDKIKPVIDKLQELVRVITALIKAMRKFDQASGTDDAVQPKAESADIFNATAEWDKFDITVREMEESLKEYVIDGKLDYFHALKTLVVNGKCFILTQANLVQKGDELATVLLQKEMESRNEQRLTLTVDSIAKDGRILELLSRAMFDRVLAIRSLVFLDFHTYSTAYEFHTLSRHSPVTLSPVKAVVDYLEDAARLQGAVVAFGSTTMVQQRFFQFSTLCGCATAQDLAQVIRSGGVFNLNVLPDDAMWNGFSRIRMSRARCYLEGVKRSSSATASQLCLQLNTSGQFFDHDFATAESLQRMSTARTFIGDPRSLIFEYDLHAGSIVCDGEYGQERDYTKHTPIANWEIRIAEDGPNVLAVKDLDFADFKGVRMEFLCEFTQARVKKPEVMGSVEEVDEEDDGEEWDSEEELGDGE